MESGEALGLDEEAVDPLEVSLDLLGGFFDFLGNAFSDLQTR